MENPHHKIDEIFRQRLHDATVPPPPFVWPAVEQALQKRRRRVGFIWLFAIGTALLSVCLWSLYCWNNTYADYAQAPGVALSTDAQEASPPAVAALPANGSAPILPEKETAGLHGFSGKEAFTSKKSSGRTDAITGKKLLLKPGLKEAFNPPAGKEYLPSEGLVDSQETKADPTAGQVNPTLEEVPAASYQALTIHGLQPVVSGAAKKEAIQPKAIKSRTRAKKSQPKLCYDFARHPSAWLLDVYAGPSLAQGSMTSRLDDEPYLNQRLATERRSVAMNAGIRASLMFRGNFLVRTGLHYDQMTEVFEYIDPTYVKVSINDVYVNGQFAGTDTIVEYGENYQKTYNRYATLDVPLLAGVEMRQGRSGFSINAGITANLLFKKQGAIIDPVTQEPARFGPKATLSQEVFRTNLGLSAAASIQWYWHIGPKFRVFVEPSFRQILRPVTLASHPVEQRYSIIGLRMGATKIF